MIFESFSEMTGLPIDQAKVFILLLLIVPFTSYFIPYIPDPLRKYYIIVFGKKLKFYSFRYFIFTYTTWLEHDTCDNTFFYSLFPNNITCYLSAIHVYRMVMCYACWNIDVSTCLMLNVCKISYFAFSYYDGGKEFPKDKVLDEDELDQNKRKTLELPGFFDYLAYCLFFPSVLIGPIYDYYDYSEYYKNPPKVSIFSHFFLRLIFSLFCFTIFLIMTNYLNFEYCLTDAWKDRSFFFKSFYILANGILVRIKYYGAWFAAEMSVIASRFSFNGYDSKGNKKWDRIITMKVLAVEFALTSRDAVINWNTSISVWLRKCIFLRIASLREIKTSRKKAFKAEYITFLISAFWHGFYPGYYIFFGVLAIVNILTKNFYKFLLFFNFFRHRSMFHFIPKYIRYLIANWIAFMMLTLIAPGFYFMSYEKTMFFIKNTGLIYYYAILVACVVSMMLPKKISAGFEKRDDEKEKKDN